MPFMGCTPDPAGMSRGSHRGLRVLMVILFLASRVIGADVNSIYSEAVGHLNAGRIAKARALLDDLMTSSPGYYRGYRVWWDAIATLDGGAVRRDVVTHDIVLFEQAPREKRDEEF